jgi:hypothetical protein
MESATSNVAPASISRLTLGPETKLAGLEDLPRSGAPRIYDVETDRRIRAILDQPPPRGFARWNGP